MTQASQGNHQRCGACVCSANPAGVSLWASSVVDRLLDTSKHTKGNIPIGYGCESGGIPNADSGSGLSETVAHVRNANESTTLEGGCACEHRSVLDGWLTTCDGLVVC